jgi:hypothetical protein
MIIKQALAPVSYISEMNLLSVFQAEPIKLVCSLRRQLRSKSGGLRKLRLISNPFTNNFGGMR